MESLDFDLTEDERVLSGYDEAEWVGDVGDLLCTRCRKVSILLFVSKFQHIKFCSDCKGVLEDGSPGQGCPKCEEIIEGEEHLDGCEHTKERALPVLWKGDLTTEEKEENKTKLEGKSESYFELNKEKSDEQIHRLKVDFEKKLETLELKIRKEINENRKAETERWQRVVSKETKNSAEIANLSEKIESLNNRPESIGRLEERSAALKKVNEEIIKILIEQNEKIVKMKEKMRRTSETINAKWNEQMKVMETETKQQVTRFNFELEKLRMRESLSKLQSQKDAKTESSLPVLILNIPQMTCFDLCASDHRFSPAMTWTIQDLDRALKSLLGVAYSQWFPWPEYDAVRSRAAISRHGSRCLTLRFDSRTKLNSLKLVPTLYYVLKDLKGNAKHKSQSKSYLFDEKINNDVQFPNRTFVEDLKDTSSYNINDSVTIEIYIEPLSMLKRVYSYDGRLVWAIDQYGKRKQAAKEGLVAYHESPYFYTGPKGYRVQVLVFLDGYVGGQSGLRAKIRYLRGEFDQDLPKAFAHCTTATLIDRKHPAGNISVRRLGGT